MQIAGKRKEICLGFLSRNRTALALIAAAALLLNMAYFQYTANVEFAELYQKYGGQAWQDMQTIRSWYTVPAMIAQAIACAVLVIVVLDSRGKK